MPRGFDDIKLSRRHAAYVVFEGVKPGVYTTWEETEAQVKGYRNNKYKGFPSLEKAGRAYHRYLKEKKAMLFANDLRLSAKPQGGIYGLTQL